MSVDWDRMRANLAAAGEGIARRRALPPGEAAKVLRDRARLLAREAVPEREAADSLEILEFRLALESYGIETRAVAEVFPLKAFTPLPCVPPFVFGVVNVRGRIATVLDLRNFFELPYKGLSDLNKVIIVQSGSTEFGILADAIVGIKSIPLGSLQPTLPTLTGIRQKYLKGVTEDQVVVLDAAKLLSDSSLVVDEQVVR